MEELKIRISTATFENLMKANVTTIEDILKGNEEILQNTNLDHNTLKKIIEECSDIILSKKFQRVDSLKIWNKIKTGCASIDLVTNGGIPVNGLTEIVGCSGVGKTQLCLILSLMVQLPTCLGGSNKGVVYICTEHVFPIKRLNELVGCFKEQYNNYNIKYQDNIFIEHISSYELLRSLLYVKLPFLMDNTPIGLIIVDSIGAVFRSDNIDVCYTNRSKEFVELVKQLNYLRNKYESATICVNQVTDDLESGKTEPCLGLAWSNLLTRRFSLYRYNQTSIREFQVVFASDLAVRKCQFEIKKEGLK